MSESFAVQSLVKPAPEFNGQFTATSPNTFGKIARLWCPQGVTLEPPVATVSRYACRLIDQRTGMAYTVEELVASFGVVTSVAGKTGDVELALADIAGLVSALGGKVDIAIGNDGPPTIGPPTLSIRGLSAFGESVDADLLQEGESADGFPKYGEFGVTALTVSHSTVGEVGSWTIASLDASILYICESNAATPDLIPSDAWTAISGEGDPLLDLIPGESSPPAVPGQVVFDTTDPFSIYLKGLEGFNRIPKTGVHTNDVRLFGAVADGVTDNAEAFERALAFGSIYVQAGPLPYAFSRAFKAPSNRTITCDRITHLKRSDGTWATAQAGLAENSDQVSGNVNIVFEGGIWDGNKPNNTRVDTAFSPQTVFRLKKVAGLTVKNLTIKDPVMFSFLAGDVRDVVIDGIAFDQYERISNGDGIHLAGPLSNFKVRNIWGNTGDDLVSLVATDAADSTFLWSQGIVEDGVVENLYAPNGNSCLRLLSGDGFKLRRVTARGLSGSFDGSGILIGDFGTGDSNFEDILIEDVAIIRSNSTQTTEYPVAQIDGNCQNIQFRNIRRSSQDVTNVPFLTLVSGLTFGEVSINGFQDHSSVDRACVHARDNVRCLSISDLQMLMTGGAASEPIIRTFDGVTALVQTENTRITGVSQIIGADTNDTITVQHINHRQTGGYMVNSFLGNITADWVNVYAEGLSLSGMHCASGATGRCSLNAANSRIGATYGLADFYQSGTQAHRVEFVNCSASDTPTGGISLNPTGSGINVSVSGTSMWIDRTLLTPIDGDQVRDATGQRFTRVSSAWV